MTQISSEQCRAARVLLGLTQRELAKRSGLRLKLVNTFESNGYEPVEKRSSRLPPCQKCKQEDVVVRHQPKELVDCPRCGTPFLPASGKEYWTPEIFDDEITKIQRSLERAGATFLFNRDQPSGVQLTTQAATRLHEDEQPMWPLHFRVARAWLNWTHETLSQMANVSPSTVRDFEAGRRTPHAQNLAKAELALKVRGIRFLYNWRAEPIGIEVVNGLAIAA